MSEYTPEKVAELRAELTRWKEQAEAASARLKATNPEEDWHGLWTIERARAEHLEADRDRLHKAITEAKAHEWSNYGDSETHRILRAALEPKRVRP